MKSNLLLLIAVALCSTCYCQFTDLCLPHPMREVPIVVQIKNAADLPACGDDGLLALPELASLAEEEIISKYQPPLTCSLVSLARTSCESIGRRRQRVLIHYKANLTCGDSCFHLTDDYVKDGDVIGRYYDMVEVLLATSRSKSGAEFNYNGRPIEIFYFRGRKGGVVPVCSELAHLQDDVNKKIPACKCPSECPHPCTLPAETGLCRAYIPQFFHNSTSGRCEQFIYGGCGGNQNRFETQDDCEKACRDDTPTLNECPEGMVYRECGSACPLNCDNKDDIVNCISVCVPGCFCEEGAVLLEEGGEVCVAPEVCPVKEEECPEGMVYQECGTACPTTCDNKDDVLRPCTLQCVQGCFCEEGTVLLEEEGEVCVDPEVCPVKEEECPEGMIYKECGTACPLTCENKDDVSICTKQCVPGCFCTEGYVLKNDSCVLPEDCEAEEVDLCTLPPETGLCRAYFRRYFYNSTSGQCEQFVYGGCHGNENNFLTVAECEDKCKDDTPTSEECPEGMVYSECGTACPTTCDNKDDVLRPCTLQCVQGCFCEEGTVLLEEEGEVCVAPEVCPVKEECPEGMIYKECGTACPLTCENKDDVIICTTQCVPGCFCTEGYVLKNNSCVLPEDCEAEEVDLCTLPPETGICKAYFRRYFYNSTSGQCEQFVYGGCHGNENNFLTVAECEDKCKDDTPTLNECPEGMVYRECGSACPLNCDNKDDVIGCIGLCVPGCFCEEGTVLLEEEGEVCVAPEVCPVKEEECPEGMVYRECGTACPTTCDNKDDVLRPCTLQCVQGCFCEQGTVLLEEEGEFCVAPEVCPVKGEECPEGMVYRECGTACPLTCDNKDDDIICTKQCVQGCFCNDSTILLEEEGEKCIAPEECPVKEEECPEGMVYRECGTACPTTCDNKDDVLRPCTLQCVQGCFCSEGTILLEKGKEECVTEDQCLAL